MDKASERPLFLHDSIVTVCVGDEKEAFHLHKGLICNVSDFFSAAFKGGFKEADGTIFLPEQDPETFRYFVHWLYTGSLRGFYYPKTGQPTTTELWIALRVELEDEELHEVHQLNLNNPHRKAFELGRYRNAPFASLIALYIMAGTLQVHGLKDSIISTLIVIYGINAERYWGPELPDDIEGPAFGLCAAYRMLSKMDKLLKLLVEISCDDKFGIQKHGAHEASGREPFHPDFLMALCEEYAHRLANSHFKPHTWMRGVICCYHEHGSYKTCTLTKKFEFLHTANYSSWNAMESTGDHSPRLQKCGEDSYTYRTLINTS